MSRALSRPVKKEIGARLKQLREERRLSLYQVARQLAPYVNIQLEGKSGETRISAIENSTANLTPELAIAYSRVFDVSLEYVFCLSNDMQPENKTIKEVLGLEDMAIAKIKRFSKSQLQILNFLIESGYIEEFLDCLDSFIYTTDFYRDFVTLSFDDRHKDSTEFVKLLPRWYLEKSISTLLDKIVNSMENNEQLKII